jgi:hypothetical protein
MKFYNQNDYPLVIAGNNPPDGIYNKEGQLIYYKWSIMTVGCYICSLVMGLGLIDIVTDPVAFNNLAKERGLFGSDNAYFDQTRIQEMYSDVTVKEFAGWNTDEAQKGLDDPNAFVILGLNITLPSKERSTHFVLLYSMGKIADPNGGIVRDRNFYGPSSNVIKTFIFTKTNEDMTIKQALLDSVKAHNWGSEQEKQARIGEIEAGDYDTFVKFSGSEVRGWLREEQTNNSELQNKISELETKLNDVSKVQISSITAGPVVAQDIVRPQATPLKMGQADSEWEAIPEPEFQWTLGKFLLGFQQLNIEKALVAFVATLVSIQSMTPELEKVLPPEWVARIGGLATIGLLVTGTITKIIDKIKK